MHQILGVVAAGAFVVLGETVNAAGPDVVYTNMTSVSNHGAIGGIRAYSFGTSTCNIGTQDHPWLMNGSPGIGWGMYRLHDGRLMQIGTSWVKLACCVANGSGCGMTCSSSGSGLRVGCMDVYSSSWNSGQGRLAERSSIDAFSGAFSSYNAASGSAIYKRLQVAETEMNSATYPGALYFVEGVYVGTQDALAGNWLNNASYKQVSVSATFNITLAGSMYTYTPAIRAWHDHGNGINNPDTSVQLVNVAVPNEGHFVVGGKVRDLGNGAWRYDYAVFNLNSHRSGGSFSIPKSPGAVVTNVGFHDVDYHSGEIYDNTDWTINIGAAAVTWSSPQTFAQNPNSNALRWGTMYNFWFDCNQAPGEVQASLGLFRPGTPASVSVGVPGPVPVDCPADITQDSIVNLNDLLVVINSWGNCGPFCPPCTGDIAPPRGDCIVNSPDLLEVINNWGACP